MLIISYGFMKSGSTLAFETTKGLLEAAGYPQEQLSDNVVEPRHKVNFINHVDAEQISALIDEIGADRRIVVKTHSGFPAEELGLLDEMVSEGNLLVQSNYRDPRDICLSLVDAGQVAREKGRQAFAELETLDDAIARTKQQIKRFRGWSSVRRALILEYEQVAFDPAASMSAIANHLDVPADHDATTAYLADVFTQFNKGVSNRYLDELTVRQNEMLLEHFGPFIQRVASDKRERWIESYRRRFTSTSDD